MGDRDPAARPWIVIRQDANGNRYRVGHYATRAEAVRMASRLGSTVGDGEDGAEGTSSERDGERPDAAGERPTQRYLVERVSRGSGVQA